MSSSSRKLLLLVMYFFLSAADSVSAVVVGVTYDPSISGLPPPDQVVPALQSLHISAVRLLQPTPSVVRAFAYTNISLLLTTPNELVPAFAANRSAADTWVHSYILPYHPRTRISIISVGTDFITYGVADTTVDSSAVLLPAIRNLRLSLIELGIRTIPVSTTFSFIGILATGFPPSSAEYVEPIGSLVMRPLLKFLSETNSSFLINLYPYQIFKDNTQIPLSYALFQENSFNFRDDPITGARYWNLFDMMVDSVIAAMAISGEENIPVIVTETGWPSDHDVESPAGNYAEIYLKQLITHQRIAPGTPLRKEGPVGTYIFQLFDVPSISRNWGIMYPNLTMKYHLSFSGSQSASGNGAMFMGFMCFFIGYLSFPVLQL